MPESVTDRPTKAHEYVFLLTKKAKYYYDADAIKEIATGYDGRQDTVMEGSEKYKDGSMLQCGNANSCSVKGRERWKYKNLQADGQDPNTMHLKRLVGEEYLSPIRNKRTVWEIATQPTPEAHFATFPEALVEPCIKAGSKIGGVILDPFGGSGTTAKVARDLKRDCILIELNPAYVKIMKNKLRLNEQLVKE
jgi:DNA modification methylase